MTLITIGDVERLVQIHFSECWDEVITISELEADEWFKELYDIVNDDSSPQYVRLQRIVDNITAGEYNT